MKSSTFSPATNRQGRRKAAKGSFFQANKKNLGYMSTATTLGLVAAGLVGVQAANAETAEQAYDRCMARGDLYVPDTNGSTTGGDATGLVIDLEDVTTNSWTYIKDAIENTTRVTNPSGGDTIILCAESDITINVNSTISLLYSGVRLVNGALEGTGETDFTYEELGDEGANVGTRRTAGRNTINFDAGTASTMFNNVNTFLTLGGFTFTDFDTVIDGAGGDVAVNASYVLNSSETAIVLDGGDSYVQSGSLDIVGSYFAYNRQAVSAEGLDSMLVDSSVFYSNGASNTVARLFDPEEPDFNDQVQGGAMYLREFDMDSQYDVTIRDSEFTANDANMGGALYLENADVLVSNVDFHDNFAYKGGAIRATDDSNLKIESESSFTDNNSVYTGGAIDMWDSELSVGDVTSTRVLFENNRSGFEDLYYGGNSAPETRNGGAIYGDNTEVFIQGTYFLDNYAEAGAAIFLTENSSMEGFGEITFKDNVAVSTGGAIQVEESTVVDLTDAEFNNNQATSYGVARGGAVHADESTMTFTDSQFSFNQANIGGAIYSTKLDASPQITENDITLINTNFVSNSALNAGGSYEVDPYIYAGGAIHIWEGELDITGGSFNSNNAGDAGGAINARNSDVVIDGTMFDENFTTLLENRAFDDAVGLPSQVAENLFEDILDFYAGSAGADRGGAIATYAGSTLDITESSFTYSESHYGGAIYADNAVTLTDTDMSGNFAREDGGALSASGNVTVDGGMFSGNRSREDGGAVYTESSLSITGAFFSLNTADSDGGAAHSDEGDVFISDSVFQSNEALDDDGGAVSSNGDSVYIYDSSFDDNEAANYGGAVYSTNDLEIVSGSTFTNNRAEFGGAIYATDDIWGVIGSFFSYNSATDDGGALYASDEFEISGSTFRSNTAVEQGGAVYGDEGTIHASTFEGNEATSLDNGRGGAVYVEYYVEVTDSTFTSNTAADSGGAIYADEVDIADTYFALNTAGEDGGAVYVETDGYINRSVFKNNSAGLIYESYDYLTGPVFSYGDSEGTSVYAHSDLDVTNSTFVSAEVEGYSSSVLRTDGYVLFNTFVGASDTFTVLDEDASLVLGNIFPGGQERIFQNGVAVTRDGKPVYKAFSGGLEVEGEIFTQDVDRNANGDPINDNGDIIEEGSLLTYSGYTENQTMDFYEGDDSWWAYLNFFTSSVEAQSSGINLHFKPTGNLARDFAYGNKVGSIDDPNDVSDVDDVLGFLQYWTGGNTYLWDLLTADRGDFTSIPAGITGDRVGIDQSGSLRTLIWDAGSREFGAVVVVPPVTPPATGGGGAPAAAPAPVIETFTSVTSSVRGFAANSAKLTAAMKAKIKKVIAANPGATTISCKGFTSAPPTPGDQALSKARGKAVCDYVRKLDPTLTVKVLKGAYENTPGQQIRRVRIVLK